jgi:probable F420-dependent oxidoreductase
MSGNESILFGVRLPCAGVLASPGAMLRVALEAEALGYDSVWVHDYLIWNKTLDQVHLSCGSREAVEAAGDDYPPLFFESLTNLAFLAGATKRIRLGTAVLVLPYRQALLTAKQVACIDVLSAGRLELGIAQGTPKSTLNEDFEVLGISRAEKVRRMRETFEAMRLIWTEKAPSFAGDFVSFPAATIYPKPVQKPYPRIWIGGSSDRSLDMVADYATGWITSAVPPERLPSAIEDLHRRMRERGRQPSEMTVATEIEASVADTADEAKAQAALTLKTLYEHYSATTAHAELQQTTGSGQTDAGFLEQAWATSLVGSPTDIRAEVERYIESGCTAFELKFIYHSIDHMIAQMRQFAQGVMDPVRYREPAQNRSTP